MTMLEAALAYAARGTPVFPVSPRNKMPCVSRREGGHGYKDATTDQDQIRRWWARWPRAMIGMPTGRATGVVVFDVDIKEGVDGFATLQAARLPLETPQATTPSGGLHLYYRVPEGVELKSASGGELARQFGPGLDTRGKGGYVVVPPSVNAAGKAYRWKGEHKIADALPVPEHLLPFVVKGARKPNGAGAASPEGTARAHREARTRSLADAVAKIAAASAGNRHGELNRQAFIIAKLIVKGRVDADEARAVLLAAGLAAMGEARREEITRTIDDAFVAAKPAPGTVDVDAELERLARLSAVEYERARKAAAERLEVRASMLDKLVAAKRAELGLDAEDTKGQGRSVKFVEPEPWSDPVAGTELLDELSEALGRYVVMSDHARVRVALWVVHAHLVGRLDISPRLSITSPVKRCGKTTLLKIIMRLVPCAMSSASITSAALFRAIEMFQPTLLIDEADRAFGAEKGDDLLAVLNAGHSHDGTVTRTVGDAHEPRQFAAFCAVVFAGIDKLPDTLNDRSIVVALQRRTKAEKIERYRRRRAGHLDELKRRVMRFVVDHVERIVALEPHLPDELDDRAGDNWEPLFAIAAVAGGEWPAKAHAAALAGREAGDDDDENRRTVLLSDISDLFAVEINRVDKDNKPLRLSPAIIAAHGNARLLSADIVKALHAIEGRPWAEYGKAPGKPITANQLARQLKPLRIAPEVIRVGTATPRGYMLIQFQDAFARDLPPEGSRPQQRNNADEMGTSGDSQTATGDEMLRSEKREKPNNDAGCCGVADENGDPAKPRVWGKL
jgi:putative DNA primase/helicase